MRQALEMALEFIERVNKDGWILADFEPEMYNTITAIKEALAQPEQEPVAWLYIEPSNPHLHVHYDNVDVSQFPHDEWFPVYKSPPQRTWVGLTDIEWSDLYEAHHDKYNLPKQGSPDGMDYERAIEAKLKEKNNG